MRKVDPLWKISSMQFEGKHREGKIVSSSVITRVNICRTIAIRHQLTLNFRFMVEESTQICKFGNSYALNLKSSPYFEKIKHFFSETMTSDIYILKWLEINEYKLQFDSVIVVIKKNPHFYIVDKIIINSKENSLYVTTKKLMMFICENIHKAL